MRSYLLSLSHLHSIHALAGTPQTVTLDVKNITCEPCPMTVKKTLTKATYKAGHPYKSRELK